MRSPNRGPLLSLLTLAALSVDIAPEPRRDRTPGAFGSNRKRGGSTKGCVPNAPRYHGRAARRMSRMLDRGEKAGRS